MIRSLRFCWLVFIIVVLGNAGGPVTQAQAAGKTVPRIAFVLSEESGQSNILSIADPDGKNVVNLFNEGHFLSPAWSPDGTQLAFMGGGKFRGAMELYLVNSDGSNFHKISTHPGRDAQGYVTWSPDGTQLIYGISDQGYDLFYRINADGTGETELTFKDDQMILGNSWITWSADGKQVAVIGYHGSSTRVLMLADANGENVRPLPIHLKYDRLVESDLAWSPDKQHLFVSEAPLTAAEPRELYVADADGSNPKVILKSPKLPTDVSSLSVSPDGKQLVFVAGAPKNDGKYTQTLWVVNADGSHLHALPLKDVYLGGTSWGMIPADKLPKGDPVNFQEAVKSL
jgi:Tol biopolymer transport system component